MLIKHLYSKIFLYIEAIFHHKMVPKCANVNVLKKLTFPQLFPTNPLQLLWRTIPKTFGSANDKLSPRYDLSSCGNAQISFRACLEQRVWFGNISWVFKTISVNDQYYCKFAFPLGYWIFNFVSKHNSIRSEIFQSKCRDSSI